LNDTVVILLRPHALEVTGAARERPADHDLGAAAARGGQAAARRTRPDRRLAGRRAVHRALAGAVRPPAGASVGADRHPAAAAVPETPLWLGYERLCREVADSISWRRFCRIGLDRPVPHPTTLVKLVVAPARGGPGAERRPAREAGRRPVAAGPQAAGRHHRVEADIDYPTDADLLEQAVRKLGGLVRRVKGRGAASRTRFGTVAGPPAGG
jgi:hypothetical protein